MSVETPVSSALSPDASPLPGPANRTLALVLVSILGLFLELMLIRWIGTEVRIFAYLQNTVLIVCFLGLGMGCFTSSGPVRVSHILLPLAALTLLLAVPLTHDMLANITSLLSVLGDLLIWEQTRSDDWSTTVLRVVAGLGLTLGLMILIWEMFVPIGRLLGRLMDSRKGIIRAYSLNVAGSLVGIWLFAGLSAFSLPPAIWLIVACGLVVPLLWNSPQRVVNLGLVAVILAGGLFVGQEQGAIETHWSPYQKLVLKDAPPERYGWSGRIITVNNAGYQGMIDLDIARTAANPRIPTERWGLSQYDLPLRFQPRPKNVLIVGAGSGNDAAGALRGNAERVTAVEIDPAIVAMGRRYHPERPYDSPQVRVVVDDARSFFATTQERYDLVIFGLLDSHTTTSMTNARLDHYVYTRESITRARQLLTDDGVMVLSFEAMKPFIADRMGRCLRDVFHQQPLAFRIPATSSGWGGVMFVVGNEPVIDAAMSADPPLAALVRQCQADSPVELTYATSVPTDDWPYIYLEHARIPTLYFLLAGMMGMLLWYGKRRLAIERLAQGWQRSDWHFFFLGAAFLLLEVQNISKASVVLGNTWIVSAVIISAILLMILLANCLVARVKGLPAAGAIGLLIVSCLGIYLVDLSSFAFLPYPLKAVIVGALTTLPMLFSGVIFIDSFAVVERKDRALGANLIGALVGGVLQSLTFVVGIKALLLIVAGLYLAAWLVRPLPARRTVSLDDDYDTEELLGLSQPKPQPQPELVEA